MATSGTYTNAFATGYSLEMRWSRTSVDIANNTSTILVETWMVNTYSISSSATKDGSITINGSTGSYTFTIGSGVINKKLFERSVVVPHNSDGTKTVSLSTYADIELTLSGKYWGRVSVSGSPTLDTIPRASTFSTLPTSVEAGSEVAFAMARASSSFTHSVKFTFGSNSNTQTGLGVTGTYTIPLSWLSAIPNSVSGTGQVVLYTYNGGTLVGTNTYNITISAPSSVVPTITSVTATRVDGTVPAAWAIYVQNKSQATIDINGAAGVYGSTISKYEIKWSTTTKTGSSSTWSLPNSGSYTFTGTVTDSRGRKASKSVTISVSAYSNPKITAATVVRCTSGGTQDDEGTYGKSTTSYTFSAVGSNAVTTKVEYRVKGGTTWTNGGTFTSGTGKVFGAGGLSINSQYEVKVSVTDQFATASWQGVIGTAVVTMDFKSGGTGVAFGMVAQSSNLVESAWPVQFTGGIKSIRIPSGADMNSYMEAGFYYIASNADAGGIANTPVSYGASVLILDGYLEGPTQIYIADGQDAVHVYRRRYNSGAWQAWKSNWGEGDVLSGDFNSYTTPGMFYSASSATVAAMGNTPSNDAGHLAVLKSAGVIQIYYEYNSGTNGKIYKRRWYNSAWSSWETMWNGARTARTNLSLTNGWVNYGLGRPNASYYKEDNGIVYLSGSMKSGTVDTTFTTLPTGFRPAGELNFPVVTYSGSGAATFQRVRIDNVGTCAIYGPHNFWVSLDGISYRAEA